MLFFKKGYNLGKNNPNWKGNDVGYGALHEWVKNHKPKPKFCEECNKVKPYDLANISGEYKRDVNDFEWLCRSCHMKNDGRLRKLIKINENRKLDKEEKRRRRKKYEKEYYQKNKERILKNNRKWEIKNRDKRREQQRKYRERKRLGVENAFL